MGTGRRARSRYADPEGPATRAARAERQLEALKQRGGALSESYERFLLTAAVGCVGFSCFHLSHAVSEHNTQFELYSIICFALQAWWLWNGRSAVRLARVTLLLSILQTVLWYLWRSELGPDCLPIAPVLWLMTTLGRGFIGSQRKAVDAFASKHD
eukprot:PLAT9279.1.p1 GENE.PLAT9279.1~~PLAT9279.1.p1  ORF type:complete len:156 (+),score=40.59 PLAT9279.1:163-630(+)